MSKQRQILTEIDNAFKLDNFALVDKEIRALLHVLPSKSSAYQFTYRMKRNLEKQYSKHHINKTKIQGDIASLYMLI